MSIPPNNPTNTQGIIMILITVFRTLFYQFLLVFIGISIGFIANAEWVGYKSCMVERSIKNIFFPIEYNDETCQKIKNWGAFKIYSFNNYPNNFKIIEEGLLGEEFYIAKFEYVDHLGKKQQKIQNTRVRWKTWEYYYEEVNTQSNEDFLEYLANGDLNSRESEKAIVLFNEMKAQKKEKKK